MKIIPRKEAKDSQLHSYQESINHIARIFPSQPYGFDESCICFVTYELKDQKIIGAKIAYNKICIKTSPTEKIYWPIQIHWEESDPAAIEGILNQKA